MSANECRNVSRVGIDLHRGLLVSSEEGRVAQPLCVSEPLGPCVRSIGDVKCAVSSAAWAISNSANYDHWSEDFLPMNEFAVASSVGRIPPLKVLPVPRQPWTLNEAN